MEDDPKSVDFRNRKNALFVRAKKLSAALPIFPVFFAAYPILSIYSANANTILISEVYRPMAVAGVLLLAVWSLLWAILRNPHRAAILTTMVFLSIFMYGIVLDALRRNNVILAIVGIENYPYIFWTLALAVTGMLFWKAGPAVTKKMTVFGGLVLVAAAVPIALRHDGPKSSNTGRGNSPFFQAPKVEAKNKPDVYFIVLDGHGREDSLKKYIQTDTSSFTADLQAMGFRVLPKSNSTYCQTELSISAALNGLPLDQLIPAFNPQSTDRFILRQMIDQSGSAAFLNRMGYSVAAIDSGYYGVSFKHADVRNTRITGLSNFETLLAGLTPFHNLSLVRNSERRAYIQNALRNLTDITSRSGHPSFVMCHILCPHPDFVFSASGEDTKLRVADELADGNTYFAVGGTPESYRAGYSGQVKYIDDQIRNALRAIINASHGNVVIFLVGDHGSKLYMDNDDIHNTDPRECFANLCAIYGPDELKNAYKDDSTLVNLLPIGFNTLFGTSFPTYPDRSYYSTWELPYVFTDVTNKLNSTAPVPSVPPAYKPK
ncbi:MAG: sulfatase-like hydrolase/transferase [Armatimonadetes bacterium]|nr:sulfatase-like hydrolase/transferase [Armatimonadota bacterium]